MTKKFSFKRTAAMILAAASITIFGAGAASANDGFENTTYYAAYTQTPASGTNFAVCVNSGYLALRNAPAYAAENEVGQLYTGDLVTFYEAAENGNYWMVYSPKYDRVGYVNKDYLTR